MQNSVLGRDEELNALRERLRKRKSFLLHGPAGVGKTLLMRSVMLGQPTALYCGNSGTAQIVFRGIAQGLLELGDERVKTSCRDWDGIQAKSAVSLKGIVMDTLREGKYCVVMDHLNRPSQSFAAVVREIIGWCSTSVIAVARSSHMEDTGFLQPLYSDRSEKYELKNLDTTVAERFAREIVRQAGLAAANLSEFLGKVVQLSEGNPEAIVSMVRMAKEARYRSDEHIKITPLYIDFRMNWAPAAGTRLRRRA